MTAETQVELRIYGRFSFMNVHSPKLGKNDKGEDTKNFCSHVLFSAADDPGFPMPSAVVFGAKAIQAVKDAQRKVAQAGWPGNWEAVLQQLAIQDKLALHDGATKAADYPEYAGKFFISANGKKRPPVMTTRGGVNVPVTEADGLAYGGAWGYLHVAIYAQDADGKSSGYGKRINSQLMGVHCVKHGDAFGGGGRVAAPEEFVAINAGEADAPMPAAAATGGSSLL